MNINNNNIKEFLNKFFDGDTDREEELALSSYFKNEKRIPKEFRKYKIYFDWIDKGLPDIDEFKKRKNIKIGKVISLSLSAAVVLGFVVTILLSLLPKHPDSYSDPNIIYEGSYISHNGVVYNEPRSILPEIQDLIRQVEDMENEIENLNFDSDDFINDM